jgi:hypothetical protein
VGFITLGPYRDAQPFAPGAFSQFFDFFFAVEEFALTIFSVQQKTFKVTEAVRLRSHGSAGRSRFFRW